MIRPRVLIVHNRYRGAGGEDVVARAEARLLRERGHAVHEYSRTNREPRGPRAAAAAAASAAWSRESAGELEVLMRRFRPDVVHVHNTWAVISAAAFAVARRHGAAVVQTLHNYRLLCPDGRFFRNGAPCEACAQRAFPAPGIAFGCYRGSRLQTLVAGAVASAQRFQRVRGRQVDLHIAPTRFARERFVQAGLPAGRIVVKPHFVEPDPLEGSFGEPADGREPGAGFALYVGRLSPEKGLDALLDAWAALPGVRLRIAGAGPMLDRVRERAAASPGVEVLGWREPAEIRKLLRGASMLIFPSLWYETFGLTIVEAFASGTPVVGSRLGAARELIDEGRTGLLFAPGDPRELADRVRRLHERPAERARLGANARREYEAKYTGRANYDRLMEVYRRAAESSSVQGGIE